VAVIKRAEGRMEARRRWIKDKRRTLKRGSAKKDYKQKTDNKSKGTYRELDTSSGSKMRVTRVLQVC
jgi:hypothetical protein